MISMARIGSASKAAGYFTRDNFQSSAENTEGQSTWWGKGADALGLECPVTQQALQAVLEGRLPDGTDLSRAGSHRPGFELTFSPPKSVSLLILLGGDKQLLEAHREAVRETLAWAEKRLVQTRLSVAGSTVRVRTDNLLVALVEHDTNRNLEPNVHTHAVIANATQGPDGAWRALVNDLLWTRNTLLGSIYHAHLRRKILDLGYGTTPQGKHGTFEITGIDRKTIEAFSTRAHEIGLAHQSLRYRTAKTRDAMALRTRRYKGQVERGGLEAVWRDQAGDLGVDLEAMVKEARRAASLNLNSPGHRVMASLLRLGDRATTFIQSLLAFPKGPADDPLVSGKPAPMALDQSAAGHAVASAIRHLSEREAAFAIEDVAKAALDLHLPITVDDVEKRIAQLKAGGLLIPGDKRHPGMLITPEAQDLESRILALARLGQGAVQPILGFEDAGRQAQGAARAKLGYALNPGQEAAARLILSSSDRVVGIQGIPGSGKTALLTAVAGVLVAHGHSVLGLGHQNRLVRLLERETGIRSQTIRRFLTEHRALLDGRTSLEEEAALKEQYRGKVLLVDEASMVSSLDTHEMLRIANRLEVQRLVLVGDKRQLGAIEAGKPFEVLQAAHLPTAEMSQNVRQRHAALRQAAKAAYEGRISDAINALRPMIQEAEDPAAAAAKAWLALPLQERAQTAIYASGRKIRASLNELVQAGLREEGTLQGAGMTLPVLDRLGITREEERYIHVYKPGQRIEFVRSLGAANIRRGTWGTILDVDSRTGKVTLGLDDGARRAFYPGKLAHNRTRESLRLFDRKSLQLYEDDRIRWTDTDKDRGLLNSDLARIVRMTDAGVLIETSTGQRMVLKNDDPMLHRLDLAYALNAHMAQGLTADRAITVMDSRERNLSSERLFLVTITRVRDHLRLITNDVSRLTQRIAQTPGDKTSALEVLGALEPIVSKESPVLKQTPSLSPGQRTALKRTPSLDLG